MTYFRILLEGGPIMIVLALCSLIAVYIFIEKWFQFHRAQVDIGELVSGLVNVLRRDGMIEAITLCDNTPGPVARLLTSAIQAYQNGDDIKQAIEDQSLVEVPRLESRLNILATVAYIAPLLGLLGTVIGMMTTFEVMQNSTTTVSDLSEGIYTALMCTAGGLAVAVPCHIAYNYLLTRVQAFCVEMEKASAEIIYFFKHHKNGSGRQDEN